ncbi:Eukaryotic translation initiation factor 4 gamma 1 [Eumeta japonica]|uniref:Eukaryotic translation initiation factor 4 gamma 1 n=1 Tax=Eumeta variegata TaxID=151549 RepID=A0A4C2A6H2_EUMVA|nr:Eukaryotic translation initiation factor 4 gamma 1 [Eumeta japonica]
MRSTDARSVTPALIVFLVELRTGINSSNTLQEITNLPTSQTCTAPELLMINRITPTNINSENDNEHTNIECGKPKIGGAAVKTTPTPTELLSASIEAVAGVKSTKEIVEDQEPELELPELSVASQAQAKLNQNLASCNHLDTANGNITTETNDITDNQEDNNKNNNQKPFVVMDKNTTSIMASGEQSPKENETIENGRNETDTISNVEHENVALSDKESSVIQAPPEKPVYVPKYKYNKDQWSPLNTSGKKCYDINFLKQVKDDPLSKNKPESTQKLEALKVMRTTPQEMSLQFLSKPINDSVMPNFMKAQVGARNLMRDPKKDNKTLIPGKGSVKSNAPLNMGSGHKGLIHVSISLREDVKLNETENAWKPSRFKSDNVDQEQRKTEEVYKKFRGILNKLTPQKFDTLMERIKKLEIDTQTRLEGVIDLVFEKAIDEPNFSEAYASMCQKLSKLKVPADNPTTPDQQVNFRNLIISRCQNQFVTNKVDEQVSKLEKDLAECTDPAKKKELQLLLEEENRKIRMRSVGNVRFIGELYKLKMLTFKIMLFCMNHLIDKPEEEKLECLCKLLTTIGQQVECETKDQVEIIFKRMQEIVDKKSYKISSRVRFMIQDVIELRKRNWVVKTVVDSQPKMMDQIQKEAEQQQRQIELMNSPMGASFRRDESGRGKRGGDNRRQGSGTYPDNSWSSTRPKYAFDPLKLKQCSKDVQNVKLAPHHSSWNRGSGAKVPPQTSNSFMGLTTNTFSVLDVNVPTDPTVIKGPGAGSRTGSMGTPRSSSGNRSMRSPANSRSASPAPTPRDASPPIQEPEHVENVKKFVKSIITDWQTDHDDKIMLEEIKKKFPSGQYMAVITDLLNITVEMPCKDAIQVSKALHYLLSCNLISPEAFISCLNEILEFAPDLFIDIPILYENLGYILSPLIEKKVAQFLEKHMVETVKDDTKVSEKAKKILTPSEAQSKLLYLMNSEESSECIREWVQVNLGEASNEDWFMRSLIQAICEYSFFGPESRNVPHFKKDRLRKYIELIDEFGGDKQTKEANCLVGIQQLIHRLEHPQGLTVELFQYLHEQYIISENGFTSWSTSETEWEGKGVMLKALTSFFINMKEAEADESCSED